MDATLKRYFQAEDYRWDAMHPEDREPQPVRTCHNEDPVDEVRFSGEWTSEVSLAYRDDMMFEASRRCGCAEKTRINFLA